MPCKKKYLSIFQNLSLFQETTLMGPNSTMGLLHYVMFCQLLGNETETSLNNICMLTYVSLSLYD